jgi:LysM repeat protein
MAKLKRLFYILLINIMVSATTTVAVLVFWESRQGTVGAATPEVVYINTTQIITATILAPPPISTTLTSTPLPTAEGSDSFPVPVAEYRVQAGDTLSTIARTFDVSLSDLMKINQIDDPDDIKVDQVLYIPIVPIPSDTPAIPTTAVPSMTPTIVTTPTATKTPTKIGDHPRAVVESVLGVGQLSIERVIIVREGPGTLSMQSFILQDNDGNEFVFPGLDLLEGGKITIHTGGGQNSVTDLYWGMEQSLWIRGELVTLKDAEGNVHSTFTIP